MTTVVCRPNKGRDQGLKSSRVVVNYAAIERKGADREVGGDVGVNVGVGVWRRLCRASCLCTLTTVGLGLRESNVKLAPNKVRWSR